MRCLGHKLVIFVVIHRFLTGLSVIILFIAVIEYNSFPDSKGIVKEIKFNFIVLRFKKTVIILTELEAFRFIIMSTI